MSGALSKLGKQRDDYLNQEEQKKKESRGALASYGRQRDNENNQGGIAGGAGYIVSNLGLGFASVGEGIADIATAGVDLLRGDTESAKQRFLDNRIGGIQRDLVETYNPGGGMQIAGDVASGIGNSATFLIPYAGPYLAALGYTGMGISNAAEQTGDVGLKELGYGVVSGGMEFLMDKFIGGAGQAAKNLGSSITRKLGREAAEAGAKATAKLAGKSFGKSVLTETLKGAAGEAIEEASQEALDPLLLRLFNIDENAKLDWKNVAYAGLVGGLSGGLMTAGPAAINYKSAVSTGKSIRESGETADFLENARLVVKGAQRKQADFTAKKEAAKAAKDSKKAKAESGTDTGKAEASTGGLGTFIQGRKDAKASRRVSQLAETVQKNLTAYEGYLNKADKTAKELEISDAILGEMRGNVFLLENAALLESYEEAILELSDEDKAELVAEVNARARASKAKKTDYTVEDLNKDTDGILAGVAGNLLIRDNYGHYLRKNQAEKAADTSESPAEATEGEETVTGEEVGAVDVEAPTEEIRAAEEVKTTEAEPETKAPTAEREEISAPVAEAKQETAPEAGAATETKEERPTETADRTEQKPAERTAEKTVEKPKPTFETDYVEVRLSEGKQMRDLSEEAYGAYNAAKVLGEALHAKIILHETLADVSGRKQNGYYDVKTHEIHVALDAGRGANGTALFTLAHEVTHYIEDWDYNQYSKLEDFVKEQIGREKMAELMKSKKAFMRTLDAYKDMDEFTLGWYASDEVIADSMETILSDGKVLEALAKRDKTLWEKIRDWVLDAIRRIKDVYAGLKPNSRAAQVLSETMTDMEKLERLFTEAAVAAGKAAQNPETADPTFRKGFYAEGVRDAGKRAAESGYDTQHGVMIDDASGTAMFSIDDIPKNQDEVDVAVNRLVAKLGVEESRARQWVQNELSLATLILRDDMVDYAHRKADRRLTAIVKNSDYKQGTLDFSNICRKRREYTRMMQRIQQAFPNRRFTAEEFATIRKIMVDEGLEVACGLCYVEDRRQNEGYIAETFREAVKSWRRGNRETFRDTKNEEDKAYNKGQTNAMNLIEKGDYLPTIADLTTVEGMEKLQKEHPDILRAWRGFNNARGMASARLLTGEAEYQRQILKYNRARVKQINDLGGLRIFSFSDFEEFHLLDIIQAVQDCAAMGIKIQFYTKVPSFALLMKDTKAKGNLSLIPKGDLGYVMMNGKPVLAYDPVEGIDFNEPAFKKVVRGNPNIGTILVGINDTQIRAAMEDDYIDYIIPFHSGQSTIVRQIKKIGKWENYKDSQTDKKLDPDSKAKPVNIYTDVIAAAEREGAPIRNERQFVERFLKVCKERGLKPRFEQFLKKNEAGEYVYTKGYYKLLLDFKMFDKDGTYLPQEAVIPEFDPKLLHELTKKYVAGEKAKTDKDTPAFNRALKRVTEEVVGGYDGIRYSIDETAEVSESKREETPFEKALRRSGLAHLIDRGAETAKAAEATEAEAMPTAERDTEAERRERIRDHEILADAFLEAAQSEQEFFLAKRYRQKAVELADAEARIGELRRKAAEVNREIEVLRAKRKSIDKGRPAAEVEEAEAWMETELNEALSRKQGYLDELDRLGDILQRETNRLLSMASAKPLRKVLREAQKKATAMERKAERVEKQAEERIEKVKKEYEFREEYKADRREMSVRERAARRVIGRLNTMFYSPTKQKHVPGDLQALVEQVLKSEKLDTFKDTRKNLRQMAELEREIEKLEQNPARTASEQERLDKMLYKYAAFEDEGLAAKGQAEALFTAFQTWMESKPKDQQDQALLDKLSSEIDKMQDMPLSQMSKESLISVENFYKLIYHQVNNANQTFATERALNIDELGSQASEEVKATKALKFLSPKGKEWAAMDGIRQYFWKNMKPLTVFEAMGSKTYTDLFQRVLDAEGVWAKDIQEAREKIVKAREKHGYKAWDLEAREAVKTKSGTVELSLSQRMALYAYAKRHQAVGHLETGGFVLDPRATVKEAGKVLTFAQVEKRLNDSTRYVMDETVMGDVETTLTAEQKAYVDEMQKYLTDMGKKGNQVSRKLYGIDIFNEEFYFPIKVKSEYLNAQTGKTGDPNIKNRGMTKEVVPGAENPLVLQGFDEVMVSHMNSMATYHAFVLPVEDLTRVLNYQPANYLKDADGNVILDDKGKPKADPDAAKDFSTLKAVIESKYGAEANDYVVQLVRDLNGGARRDAAAGLLDRGITAFKRASTMASLSVLIQQPTSIVRAGAYIDYKYLMGSAKMVDFKNHKELWERVKKYAPVAVIKEMGGYDTGVGLRTSDYLDAQEYGKGERIKGFLSDEAYRAEIFGKGAAYADEAAWIQLFEACTLEQADKLGKSRDSEEVLTAAGKRFEEIIRHTQVYDSTLTRSEYMRSKDTGAKMATAFMAEPTTIVSMVAEAIMRGERGDVKFLRRTAGSVAAAIILNALAVSLIYAMRDDDEDKTYGEKYVSTLTMEIADGFNPAGYLPVARDIVSILQGYEVERTDMALIGNLVDQVSMITSSKRSVTDKVFGVSGAVSAFFGIPLTNVYRDAKGAINTLLGQVDTETTTGAGLSAAVKEEFNTIFKLFDDQTTNGYQLYKAFVSGDTAHYNRVAARYESEAAVEQALRKELRERDRRIGEAAEARMAGELDVYESIIEQIAGEGIFERNMIIRAINNEINSLKDAAERGKLVPKDEEAAAEDAEEVLSLYSTTDLNDALERGDREDFSRIYQTLVTGKTEQGKTEAQAKGAVKSSVTAYWKKRYIAAWEANDTAEIKRIQSILQSTGLYGNRNEVAKLGQGWIKAYAAGKK